MAGIDKRISKAGGFTIVEMLVTLVIIGIVLAMLLPAFTAVQKVATEVKQKAQFSNIEMGLESFRADFGDYPESGPSEPSGEILYGGAQKLAEALVGQDGFGVHNKTEFRLDGRADLDGSGSYVDVDKFLYDIAAGNFYENPAENKASRRGPYLELESANAVRLQAIYPITTTTFPSPDMHTSLVLADMFGLVKNLDSSKKIGLPVLYYKADTTSILHQAQADWASHDTNIYSINHNRSLLSILEPPFKDGRTNPLKDIANANKFYDMTRNPNFVGTTPRPYRAESFILHSAGPDGVYGSPDDLFNFDPGK